MPWTNSDPLAAGFGTAAAFLGGQQEAKDRKRKQAQEDEQDRQTAIANQTAVGYKDAMQRIAQQNADTRTTAEADTTKDREAAAAEKVKNDLMIDGTKRFSIQQTAIYHSTMSEDAKQRTFAMIQARHQDIQAQITSGQLKTDKEVAAKYAAIDASIQNNIRSTSTSAANNERSTATSAANNERTTSTSAANSVRSSDTSRANNANSVSGATARAAMATYSSQLKANATATAAGNDPPFPDLKPPAAAAAAPTALAPNPAVASFVKIAASVPKAQREKLVTTSKPYMSADPATQKAILAAVQALP